MICKSGFVDVEDCCCCYMLVSGGIPSGRRLCLLISSLWRANMYVVCIISLVLGSMSPCARILKKLARVVGLT